VTLVKGLVELVVASGKGGVGKSTLTASLAVLLARRGVRMSVVDADAEAPNLYILLGVGDDEWSSVEVYREGRVAYIRDDICTRCGVCADVCPYGAVERLEDGRYYINPWICEGCITCSAACPDKAIRYRFNVEAGVIKVAAKTRYGFPFVMGEIRPGRPNSGKLVTELKNRGKALLGGEGLLLVDAAAGIGCQVISSLTGAQLAILVAEPTPASLSDLKRVHKLAKHFGIASMLVINKYDLNPDYVSVIEEYARSENMPVLGRIPYDETVAKAAAAGRPLVEYDPDSPAAKAIAMIEEKLATEVLPNWREWWSRYRPSKPEPYVPVIIGPGGRTGASGLPRLA